VGGRIAGLLYLALAIAATWPLAGQLDSSVAHDLGDPLLVTYLLNWNARVAPFTDAWWHPPFFWPSPHVMAASEHLLGLSLIASPLIWLGVSPLATYNLLFIASFWTAGVAGWVLGRTLTGRAAPAWLCGLVFMFAPYRFSHLPHLQILFSCGVPLLFAALHRTLAVRTTQPGGEAHEPSGGANPWKWPAIVAACWLWQGLVSGYFLAFLPVAILLWLVWFAPRDWPVWGRVAAAGGVASVAVAPLLWRYTVLQDSYGFQRGLNEVLEFSADVAGLWQVSDKLAFWGELLPKGYAEEQLFPGLTPLIIAALSLGSPTWPTGSVRTLTKAALGVAAVLLSAAGIAVLIPGGFTFLGVDVSITSVHKPLGAAWIALAIAIISTRRFQAARNRTSPVAGYAVIAAMCWLLALGPAPTLYGDRIWYLAPYAWLHDYVPGFTAFRVPARFFLVTTVSLAAMAALGVQRAARRGLAVLVPVLVLGSMGVIAEGWLARMPLAAAPQPIAIPTAAVAVLELPAGDPARDATAMYRSLFHGRPVVNGWTGYRPASAEALSRADAGDVNALDTWTRYGPLAVIVHRDVAHAPRYEAMMQQAGAACRDEGGTPVCLVMQPNHGR
jgi:hypothetical protein